MVPSLVRMSLESDIACMDSTGRRNTHIAATIGLLGSLVVAAAIVLPSMATAALNPVAAPNASFTTTGTGLVAGMTPGATLAPETVAVTAQGALHYTLAPRISGSAALARQIVVTITTAAGDVIYSGPLSGARVGDNEVALDGRSLAAGETESLTVSQTLPLSAGDDIMGASLQTNWVLTAVGSDV